MKNIKKMIAPLIISAVFVLYYIGAAIAFLTVPGLTAAARALLVIIPACLCAFMIWAVIARIKEIGKGEEDDLGKY